MADTTFRTVLPPLKAVDNLDGTYSVAAKVSNPGALFDDVPVNGEVNKGATSNWAFDHSVDLDAHTYNIFQELRTGVYISSPVFLFYVGTGVAVTANRLYAIPFPVVRPMTLDRLEVYIVTGDAGKVGRLGLYAPGTNLAPGALVIDGGEVSVAANAGVAVTINKALTTKGIYWIAFVSDGTPSIYNSTYFIDILGHVTNSAQSRAGWYAAHNYAALPDPFPSPTSDLNCWKLALRIASLD